MSTEERDESRQKIANHGGVSSVKYGLRRDNTDNSDQKTACVDSVDQMGL